MSINRFDHQPLQTEEKIRPPISPLRKQSSLQDRLKLTIDGHVPRYDYYTPIQRQNPNRNQYDSSLFRDESNAYEYDVDRQEFYSSHRQTPVDKLMRTHFSMPDKITWNSPENDNYNALRRDHVWNSSPFTTKPTEQLLTQDYNINAFFNPLSVPPILSNENKLQISSQTRKSNHKTNLVNYPEYGAGLYPRPPQRVHNSLPDCNSVSSAVLCKPPLHFRGTFQENRDSENSHLFHDIRHTETLQTLSPDEESHSENSPPSEVALELTDDTHNIYPPHLVPNSYPLRSEIYKNFFSDLSGVNQPKRDKNCQKSTFTDGTTSGDYITPLESHRFSDSADTNDLSSYNLNAHALSLAQSSGQKPSQYSGRQNELYSRLIRIIQSDESLNKLRNLLLQSNHLPSKTTSETESPKLSLLGVLILPSSVIKELDYNHEEKLKYVPEDFDDKSLSENSSESDISDDVKNVKDISKPHSIVIYDENVESKDNASVDEVHNSENEHSKSTLDLPLQQTFSKNNPALKTDFNSSNVQLPAETVTSPKLYVYDEQSLLDKEKNGNSNFSTDNWRKILEDEISKEIRESTLHGDIPSLDTILDESINSGQNKHSHENQHSFNKHIGPLYDSTGKLIQPENVPIHIHRFNPPSGLTSLPWKFSIPRPAPPRSIVVPPKPPTLS